MPRATQLSRKRDAANALAGLGLGPDDVEVLTLYFLRGRSCDRIGESLGRNKKTINVRITRCQRKLIAAGLPPLVQPEPISPKRRIHLDDQLMDALLSGLLPPLLRDKRSDDPALRTWA